MREDEGTVVMSYCQIVSIVIEITLSWELLCFEWLMTDKENMTHFWLMLWRLLCSAWFHPSSGVCVHVRACVMDTAGSVVDVIFGMSLFASTLFWMFHACLSSLALLLPQLNKSLCHLWLGLCLWKDTGIILYSCITQWTSNLSLPEGWGGWISIVVSVQVPAPKSVCSNMIPHRAHMTEKKRYHVKIYFCQFILICILWWYAT